MFIILSHKIPYWMIDSAFYTIKAITTDLLTDCLASGQLFSNFDNYWLKKVFVVKIKILNMFHLRNFYLKTTQFSTY